VQFAVNCIYGDKDGAHAVRDYAGPKFIAIYSESSPAQRASVMFHTSKIARLVFSFFSLNLNILLNFLKLQIQFTAN